MSVRGEQEALAVGRSEPSEPVLSRSVNIGPRSSPLLSKAAPLLSKESKDHSDAFNPPINTGNLSKKVVNVGTNAEQNLPWLSSQSSQAPSQQGASPQASQHQGSFPSGSSSGLLAKEPAGGTAKTIGKPYPKVCQKPPQP